MFSNKATKIDEIFTVDSTCSKCQIDSEDLINFCGLLKKHELYLSYNIGSYHNYDIGTKYSSEDILFPF